MRSTIIHQGKTGNFSLNLLGDVKFPINYGDRLIVGLQRTRSESLKSTLAIQSNKIWIKSISSIISWNVSEKNPFNDFSSPFPICNHLLFYKTNGIQIEDKEKSSKKTFHDYYEQINSAFSIKRKDEFNRMINRLSPPIDDSIIELKMPIRANLYSAVFPMLVFGNKIKFI